MAIEDEAGFRSESITPIRETKEAYRAELLRTLLGDSPSLVPFAEAVIDHLSDGLDGGVDRRPEIMRDVVDVLRAIQDEEEILPTGRLMRSPALLASFFQNADLLDTSAPETAGVARLVMSALAALDGELE